MYRHPETESLRDWSQIRLSTLFFVVGAFIVLAYCVGIDRAYLIDQSNYVENFATGPRLGWLEELFKEGQSPVGLVVQIFSEELLWNVWTALLGSVFEPETSVLVTVCILNLLMIGAAWRISEPVASLALWIILPLGLATVGLLQLRQGFGFAVMMFSATYLRRPLVGTLIAAMIHTTFAVAFIFAAISWIFRSRQFIALIVAVSLAFLGAYAGSVLFEMFGGRRLLTYSASEGATSINYVITALIMVLPSVYWLVTVTPAEQLDPGRRAISIMAVIHAGISAFVIFSFFIFPLGAGRIGYMTMLSLIAVFPSLRLRASNAVLIGVAGAVGLYLLYLVGKAYADGTFSILLSG